MVLLQAFLMKLFQKLSFIPYLIFVNVNCNIVVLWYTCMMMTSLVLTQVSSEALSNIRTIAGLAKEMQFVSQYERQLEAPYKAAKKKAHVYGICFAFAKCVIFMAYAASFRYGGFLVNHEGLQYMIVFRFVLLI